jgi:putative transposase
MSCPRVRAPEYIHHLMCKSVDEIYLFKSGKDKDVYIRMIKRYSFKYNIKILAFCIMDNHVHMLVDPQGGDISKFMQGINLSYTIFFNSKYNRTGHLFHGKFKNKVVNNDSYLLTVSAYIHNNSKDIKNYRTCTQEYPYSSFGIYIGIRKDKYHLVDCNFILSMFDANITIAKAKYFQMVRTRNNTDSDINYKNNMKNIGQFAITSSGTHKLIARNYAPQFVVQKIAEIIKAGTNYDLHIKYDQNSVNFKAVCIQMMSSFCGYTYNQISKYIGNITISSASRLSARGYKILQENKDSKNIMDTFLAHTG